MKITWLELETNDLETTKQFYQQRLGLPLLAQSPDRVVFQAGWTELVFRQAEQPIAPYHFAFNVPLYTLEQYQLWFDLPYIDTWSPGCRIANFPNWKARASYFPDPTGNVVEFIERRDAGYEESAGGYFQCVSEIGLVTHDVAATTAHLSQKYNIDQFAKSQPLPDFNAVGDDYGLLILAKTDRPWLFTTTKAALTRWRMSFNDAQGNSAILDTQAEFW
ncbi:VOC family protein [Spirosoma gilvum]